MRGSSERTHEFEPGLCAPARITTSQSGGPTLRPDFIAGLAISADGRYLYAVNHQARATNAPGSLIVVDLSLAAPVQVGRFDFTAANGITRAVTIPSVPGFFAAGTVSNFPYAVTVKGATAYVASTHDNTVYALNVSTPTAPTLAAQIPAGNNPLGLVLNGTNLYVANAHSDTISIVDTGTNTVSSVIDLRPAGAKTIVGVTPNQMTVSPDGKTLYAALSDFDAVAAIDVATNKIKGEIPVGWYPSAVVVSPDGKRILVSNARGSQTRYPNPGQQVNTPRLDASQYPLNLVEATVQTIPIPTALKLTQYTQQVLSNNRITPSTDDPTVNPLFSISKANGGITHIFYVIRENRTYDQVLGDLNTPANGNRGNGDPSLTLFGSDVTPNIHALVNRFVLLDNFFDVGDASMEGWDWTTAAISSEHMARNQPYNYSSRGANYDSEGTVNNYPVAGFPANAHDQNNNPLPQLPAINDLAVGPNGRVWDSIKAAGNTVRNYGTMIAAGYPAVAGLQPGAHYDASMGSFDPSKHGLTDLDFAGFSTNIAESAAPWIYASQIPAPANLNFLPSTSNRKYGQYTPTTTVNGVATNAYNRFDEWNREFQAMLTNDVSGSTVPNFELVRFGRDHTSGINAGSASAKAMVADNDYAVGRLVDVISHSPIWAHSAIFVLEDDAQNGPDHVDSHRSVGFVYSPYIKPGSYSGKFYSTNSFLRTMELLLNARPLTHYDAIANYIDAWDNAPNNIAPYTAILPTQAIVTEVLTSGSLYAIAEKAEFNRLVKLASKMDFAHADANDPALLNEMIWKSVKGMNSKMPAPKNALGKKAASKTSARKTAQTNKDIDD
jgi:YVTN family beta-propeller protein